MTHFGRKLTIFIAITRIAEGVTVPYSLEDYVVTVIKHLTSVDTAIPSVVFYDLSLRNPFQKGILGKVLHQTTRREKLILLSMVVLMFFITNAYSTKLITMLINHGCQFTQSEHSKTWSSRA